MALFLLRYAGLPVEARNTAEDEMGEEEKMLKAARAALERRPEIDLHAYPIDLAFDDGALVMDGEVENIVARRLARHELTRLFGAEHLVDRLRVRPGERRGDGAIADDLYKALSQEPVLRDHAVAVRAADRPGQERAAAGSQVGAVSAEVRAAVVLLDGQVLSLTHKRLADVLAWWTPGVCEVENRLHVVPPEQDSDDEISDALRIVLEKDPWLDAGQIAARVEDHRVILEGLVPGEEQRAMAAQDAWTVLGVHDVDNRLHVRVRGSS